MIENFMMVAMHAYQNVHCSTVEEFEKDLEKITYLNKLFYRYYEKGELNFKLMLNHTIILYNVFESQTCTEMLFFKIKKEYWTGLKTFLTFLGYMPEIIKSVNVRDVDIPIDMRIAEELRKI